MLIKKTDTANFIKSDHNIRLEDGDQSFEPNLEIKVP